MQVPQEVQNLAVRHVQETTSAYQERMQPRKTQLMEVFEAYSSFKEKKERNWATSFKINKAHEVAEKIVPAMTAKDPRWIVTIRNVKAFRDTPEISRLKEAMTAEQGGSVVDMDYSLMKQKEESVKEMALAVQDYLTYLFDEYSYMDDVEIWAKNMIADGKGYVDIGYKFEKCFVPKKVPIIDSFGGYVKDEQGQLMYSDSLEPVVTGEHPTIEIVDWADLYYDPRYISANERPAWVRIKNKVRLADILRYKDRYINLDKLEAMTAISDFYKNNLEGFREKIAALTGIAAVQTVSMIDKNALCVKIYQGYFSHTGQARDERLYKIVTVNDVLCIQIKEITHVTIEEVKCFPNTKDGNAVGFIEPILGLQEEFNFKKNAGNEYINKSLQRQRVWSENSGIDPSTLNDPIIPTTADGQTAIQNIPEVPMQQLGSDFFADNNDFERQIQSATHTIDTSNPRSQNALTDTATGAKIKFYESNKVLDAVRRRFERGLARLAYKLLQCSFDNMSDNIVFKKTGSEGYWYMNKEVLRDALNKYQIKVEANSSSFTDVEDRRDEALAWFGLLERIDTKLADSGSPRRVDFSVAAEDVGSTFEKKDINKFLTTVNIPGLVPGMGGVPQGGAQGGSSGRGSLKPPAPMMTGAEEITNQVVGKI